MTDIIDMLNQADIRPSYQRVSILAVLRSTKSHPTVDMLHGMLKESGYIGISKATLYNTLKLFAEKGIISLVDTSSAEAHYDANTMFHPHFVCECCGKIIDCEGELPVVTIDDGCTVNRFTMNISGLCSECSKKI